MNVDPYLLARHFGFSIRHPAEPVKGKADVRIPCPLHPDPDTSLSVRSSEATGTVFSCDHPGCRFKGDAIALAALVRKTTAQKAVEMFRPGGEFSDCLSDPMSSDEAEAYAANANAQASVKAYLAKCRQALRLSPERGGIRTGVSQASARLVHPSAGLFVPGDDVPRCLSEFSRPKYRGACLVLYPYERNGEVTRIDVFDSNNPVFRRTVVVTHPSVGVFGEDIVTGCQTVIAFDDPRSAATAYASCLLSMQKPLPITSFQGYPLPESMCGTQNIRIVSTSDRPVSTESVVRMLSAPVVLESGAPRFRIANTDKTARELTAHDLSIVMDARSGNAHDPHEFLVRRFAGMVRDGQQARIVEMLVDAQTPVVVRNMIREEAESIVTGSKWSGGDLELARELVQLLSSDTIVPSADVRLANGKTLHSAPTEVYATGITGRGDLLCNVGLSVDSKIVSSDGEEILACTATHSDSNVPPVQVRITERDAGDADRLQSIVSKAFSAKGANPYVAFYRIHGYSWRDVFAKLSEHCAVSREIGSLGVDSASEIQLPEVVVRPDGTQLQQTRIFTMPECAVRAYSGIPYEPDGDTDAFVSLFSKCDNLYVAAFALGVCHVLYQMSYGVFRPETVKSHMMRHLLYVETEPGIWGAVFRQLAGLFSGEDFTPTVNYSDPGRTFSEYEKLGSLPLIAYLPTIGSKIAAALDCSGIDLIGLSDTSTAVMTNGKMSAVYVTPSDDTPMERGIIDGRDIDSLRVSFAPMLARFVHDAKIDTAFRSSSMPCLAAYDECCRILGVERSGLVDRIAKGYFPGVGMNGAMILYDLMHRSLVDDGKPSLCVVNGEPQRGYSFTRRGQHVFVMKDVVIVSHMVVDVYNMHAKGRTRFDVDQLTSEMEATGVLAEMPDLGIDGSRCWCMSRDAWEAKVVRPPINLLDEVRSGTIKLGKIERENG